MYDLSPLADGRVPVLRYVFPGATVVAALIGLMVASYRWDNIFLSGRAIALISEPPPELPMIQVPAPLPPGLDNPSLPQDLPSTVPPASSSADVKKSPAAAGKQPLPASPAPPGPVGANRLLEQSPKAFSASSPLPPKPDGNVSATNKGSPRSVLEQRQVVTDSATSGRASVAPRFAMHRAAPTAPYSPQPQSPPAPVDSDRDATLSLSLPPPAAPALPPVVSPAARLLSARNQIIAGDSAQARLELEKAETQLAFVSSTNPRVLTAITDCLGALAFGDRDAALRHLNQAVSAAGGQPGLTTADESHGERPQP